jgi:hypothetical protein
MLTVGIPGEIASAPMWYISTTSFPACSTLSQSLVASQSAASLVERELVGKSVDKSFMTILQKNDDPHGAQPLLSHRIPLRPWPPPSCLRISLFPQEKRRFPPSIPDCPFAAKALFDLK